MDQNVFTVDENDKQLISLGEKETIQFFKKIDGFKKNKAIENKNKEFELCLSQLCLNYDDKKFVVFYKKAHFNPAKKTITISNQLFFNMAFYLEKPSKENMYQPAQKMIRDYLDIDTEDFLTNYESNPEYWKDEISKVAKSGEVVDDHPYVFVQARDNGSTSRELFHIKELAQKNNLSVPLKAFFGQMKKTLIRSAADFSILNLDQPNIDQLLVVYNSLLQPITYVQGPPGTGKTRTIVNIIFSIIFNGQTALITSNNNKPINDIVEKLDSYNTNKTGKMLLPFIRLGNYEETIAGLRTIIPRLEIALRSKFNAGLLKKSQNSNKSAVKETLKRLNDYELRKELEEEINAFDSLITVLIF